MKGFSRVVFGADGATASAVMCASCGQTACFCQHTVLARSVNQPMATETAPKPSPALSALSVSLHSEMSPTYSFQPVSGGGTTLPPPFELGGPSQESNASPSCTRIFDGGSPTWLFQSTTFALSATGAPQVRLPRCCSCPAVQERDLTALIVHRVRVSAG